RPARSVALVGHPRWRGRCHYRKEPAVMSSVRPRGDRIYLGLDVHKDSISAGILGEYDDTVDVDKIFHDEDSVRRLIGRFPDPRRARQRLLALLLRHGQVYRGGTYWTIAHEQWLGARRFTEAAVQTTFDHYRAVVLERDAALAAVSADLLPWRDREPFADAVHRLGAYRGVAELGALSIASEVGDWRRFPRAQTFMGFTGLVPSEY